MVKKISVPQNKISLISCDGCKYKENDDGIVMWCAKIRMPRPSKTFKNCIYKSIK